MRTERDRKIVRTSLVGIGVNLVLVLFKTVIGFLTNSIAILLDAVNNLSDALSSIITIIGTRLAGRRPDKKHPYGYGRIEYLTSVIIAVIVLMAGLTSLKESALKAIAPETASYSVVSLIIITVAIAAKLLVGRYVKKVGEEINAQSLVASGSDALFDAILSLGTLIAAVVSLIWGISLEGIIGVIISVFILKAGLEMLLETLNSIIGIRADRELSEALKKKVGSYDAVRGVYDLTLHNYGPTEIIGSVHIEVPDEITAREIHRLTRQITSDVFVEFGIILTVGIYAANTSGEFGGIRETVEEVIAKRPEILQMHGFYVERETQHIMFDLIVDFQADARQVRNGVLEELSARCPDWHFDIILDSDYSD